LHPRLLTVGFDLAKILKVFIFPPGEVSVRPSALVSEIELRKNRI